MQTIWTWAMLRVKEVRIYDQTPKSPPARATQISSVVLRRGGRKAAPAIKKRPPPLIRYTTHAYDTYAANGGLRLACGRCWAAAPTKMPHLCTAVCFLFRCHLHGAQTGTFTHTYATTCMGAPTITPLGLVRPCKLSHRCERRCRPTPAKMAQIALLVGDFV